MRGVAVCGELVGWVSSFERRASGFLVRERLGVSWGLGKAGECLSLFICGNVREARIATVFGGVLLLHHRLQSRLWQDGTGDCIAVGARSPKVAELPSMPDKFLVEGGAERQLGTMEGLAISNTPGTMRS